MTLRTPLTAWILSVLLLAAEIHAAGVPQVAPTNSSPTISKPSVSYDAALAIASAGLDAGRSKGINVALVVTDNAGLPLVVLRTNHATEQFVTGATRKAWTSVNFRASTRDLFETIKSNQEDDSQLPHARNALFLMGGVPLISDGVVVGAVGAAGSPSGLQDDAIAREAADVFNKLQ